MDNTISIVKTRDNELEFDINITGGQKKDPVVRLVIEDTKVNYTFECSNIDGDKWVAKVPPLPHLTKKTYTFRLEVIIDGYFFEPYKKKLSVIPDPVVKSSKVAEKHPETPVVKKKRIGRKKPVKKVEETETIIADINPVVAEEEVHIPEVATIVDTPDVEEDSFADMASTWMNRQKPVVTEQDKKVKSLIKDALESSPVSIIETPTIVKGCVAAVPEIDKAKQNDIKIKAILDSTKIK